MIYVMTISTAIISIAMNYLFAAKTAKKFIIKAVLRNVLMHRRGGKRLWWLRNKIKIKLFYLS